MNFKKIYLIVCVSIVTTSGLKAQGNLTYYDDRPLHFGFSLGVNFMDFGIVNSKIPDPVSAKVYSADVSSITPGFSVGVVSDLRLNRYLNLRFNPGLHFGSRVINYSVGANENLSTEVQSIPLYFPLYLKYSAERKGNYRPYLIWGCGMSIDLGGKKEVPILLKPLNFYTEFGVGCDLYFSYFKLAPELKFAIGFNDVLTPLSQRTADVADSDKKFSNAISKLTSRLLTLTFNFE